MIHRYLSLFNYIKILYNIPQQDLWDFQVFLIYLDNKLTNSDFNSLMKDIEDVSVSRYAIPEAPQEVKEKEGKESGKSGKITAVRQVKTVQEVIHEINLKFRELITADGVRIVGEFFEDVTKDETLKAIIISNKGKNPETVYDQIIKEELVIKLQNFVASNSPDLYEKITGPDIMPYINRQAYELLRGVVAA